MYPPFRGPTLKECQDNASSLAGVGGETMAIGRQWHKAACNGICDCAICAADITHVFVEILSVCSSRGDAGLWWHG